MLRGTGGLAAGPAMNEGPWIDKLRQRVELFCQESGGVASFESRCRAAMWSFEQ